MDLFASCFLKLFCVVKNIKNKKNIKNYFWFSVFIIFYFLKKHKKILN